MIHFSEGFLKEAQYQYQQPPGPDQQTANKIRTGLTVAGVGAAGLTGLAAFKKGQLISTALRHKIPVKKAFTSAGRDYDKLVKVQRTERQLRKLKTQKKGIESGVKERIKRQQRIQDDAPSFARVNRTMDQPAEYIAGRRLSGIERKKQKGKATIDTLINELKGSAT